MSYHGHILYTTKLMDLVLCLFISNFAFMACVCPLGSFRHCPAGRGLYQVTIERVPYSGGGHRKAIPIACIDASMLESGTLDGLSGRDTLVVVHAPAPGGAARCGVSDVILSMPLCVLLPYASYSQLLQLLRSHNVLLSTKQRYNYFSTRNTQPAWLQ